MCELDLSDLEQLEPFVKKIYDTCGQIDILINNGGVSHRGSILHTTLEVDKKIMYTNYFGSVGLTKGIYSMNILYRKYVFLAQVDEFWMYFTWEY